MPPEPEILTPFETATQCIQGDKVVTSSMIVPCIRVLKATMNTLSQFVSILKASVNSRLSHYEEYEANFMASALNPRFNLKSCSSVEYNTLKANFVANVKSVNSSSLDINSHDLIQGSSHSPCSLLIEEYLSTLCLPQEADPLVYWKTHDKQFSCISTCTNMHFQPHWRRFSVLQAKCFAQKDADFER